MSAMAVALSRRLRPGAEAAFEDWLRDVAAAAAACQGYLGMTVLRPASPQGDATEITTVLRFQEEADWRRWEASPERQALLARADSLAGSALTAREADGLDFWFDLPGAPTPAPPARWKMVAVVTGVVFVSFDIIPRLYEPLRAFLPAMVVQLLGIATAITLMTYVIMPRLTKLLHAWLVSPGLWPARTPG